MHPHIRSHSAAFVHFIAMLKREITQFSILWKSCNKNKIPVRLIIFWTLLPENEYINFCWPFFTSFFYVSGCRVVTIYYAGALCWHSAEKSNATLDFLRNWDTMYEQCSLLFVLTTVTVTIDGKLYISHFCNLYLYFIRYISLVSMCCLICRNKCLSNVEPTHPPPPKKGFFLHQNWLVDLLFILSNEEVSFTASINKFAKNQLKKR